MFLPSVGGWYLAWTNRRRFLPTEGKRHLQTRSQKTRVGPESPRPIAFFSCRFNGNAPFVEGAESQKKSVC